MSRFSAKLSGLRALGFFDNRVQLFLSRLFFPGARLVPYRLGRLEFIVDHGADDQNGTRDVLVSPMYRRLLAGLPLAGRPLRVLDFGANGGGFPLLLASLDMNVTELLCVEMNPQTFTRLHFNVGRNFLEIAPTLLNRALAGSRREERVPLGAGSTGDSLFHPPQGADGQTRTTVVRCETFDDLLDATFPEGPVDLCKMDVEGAEYEVLAAPETCRGLRRCRFLLMEIHDHPGRDPAAAIRSLEAMGLREVHRSADGHPDVHLFENPALAR